MMLRIPKIERDAGGLGIFVQCMGSVLVSVCHNEEF